MALHSHACGQQSAVAKLHVARVISSKLCNIRPVYHPACHNVTWSTCSPYSGAPTRRCRSTLRRAGEIAAVQEASQDESHSDLVPKSKVWELDFCSRPLLDERGKKVWELLICDAGRTFTHAQYFPNNKINSAELRKSIEAVLAREGAVKPEKAKFFRGQMQTIITKALADAGIKAVPSRRCLSVMSWLRERVDTVYKQDSRYSDKAQSMFTLDLGSPEPLPDALRGERWAFVQLPLGPLLDLLKKTETGDLFGATFDLKTAGLDGMTRDTLVPGVAVFSARAKPLAAWTNGLEIASVKADVARSCLVLETGVSQRWRYGGWRTSPDSITEAQAWEEAKSECGGLHFLAVQPDPDSEDLNGLWLMQDKEPPQI